VSHSSPSEVGGGALAAAPDSNDSPEKTETNLDIFNPFLDAGQTGYGTAFRAGGYDAVVRGGFCDLAHAAVINHPARIGACRYTLV
jgi:hypothetical protein